VRRTPLARTPVSPASETQRAKVAGHTCLVCGGRPADPAHLVPRALGGCDEPDCIVPLCRRCHRAYDGGELDLLPHLEPGSRAELAPALRHGGAKARLRRLVVVAERHGRMPRIHMRGLGQLEQMELVAVALEPGHVVGKLLWRRHALEPEQLVEVDARIELGRFDFE
jgi:hypothetical protein